jgi:hypothetical protein
LLSAQFLINRFKTSGRHSGGRDEIDAKAARVWHGSQPLHGSRGTIDERSGTGVPDMRETRLMAVRIALFFGLVLGLAGVTTAMGTVISEPSGTCVAYKTC